MGRILDTPTAGNVYIRHLSPRTNSGVLETREGMAYSYDHRPSHPYNAGAEHVEFTRNRQLRVYVSSAKRREALGESHEGSAASFYNTNHLRRTFFHMDDSVE